MSGIGPTGITGLFWVMAQRVFSDVDKITHIDFSPVIHSLDVLEVAGILEGGVVPV